MQVMVELHLGSKKYKYHEYKVDKLKKTLITFPTNSSLRSNNYLNHSCGYNSVYLMYPLCRIIGVRFHL